MSKYSFLMNDNAGIHDDLIITKVDNGFMIILNAACKENDFKIIEKKLEKKFDLKIREDLSLVALQGPEAKNVLEKIIPKSNNLKFMHGDSFVFEDMNKINEALNNTSEVIKRFPELPKLMDKANDVITLLADRKLTSSSLAFHSLKEEELKMQIMRNKVLGGLLILVILTLMVF